MLCVLYVYNVCRYMHMWKPDRDLGCLLNSLLILFFETHNLSLNLELMSSFCIDAGIQTLSSHAFKPCPQPKNLLYNWVNLYPGISLTVQVLLYKIFMQWEIKSSQRNCFPFMCFPLWIVSHLDEIFYKQKRKKELFLQICFQEIF